jgi:uncharacterized protein YabN with tetrapyrrole methylase and pyrophosphatase domain
MMMAIELAWRLIDELEKQYADKDEMVNELGNLDDLVLLYADIIENNGLTEETDLVYLQAQIDDMI